MRLLALEVLQSFKKHQVGIGAFNFVNLEVAKAIVEAAEKCDRPVILQASMGAINYAGLSNIVALGKAAKETCSVPVILHLDHGNFDYACVCIEAGFDSVMFDGSELPVEENIAKTRQIVKLAHKRKYRVTVEAEIGKISGVEEERSVSDEEASHTTPEEALHFVKKTGCDSLAIAVGTAHGVYQGTPNINYELIEQIAAAVPKTPLVLHGSSGVPLADLQKTIEAGITKINIDTDVKLAFTTGLRQTLEKNPKEYDLRKYLKPASEAAQQVIEEKIRAFAFMEAEVEADPPATQETDEKDS
jgi:fructose-bisphosphate aldolase class II